MKIKSFKELIVWQKSIKLVEEIYLLTSEFPKSELFGLTSQVRRAAVSVPSNIAEGYGRKSNKEYQQFYAIAYGSSLEVETQLIIAKNIRFAEVTQFQRSESLVEEVQKMLYTMLYKKGEVGSELNSTLNALP